MRLLARELIEQMSGGGYRISDVFLRAWANRLAATGVTLPRE